MIDTTKPVRFLDDRNKVKDAVALKRVLFQNHRVCLCLTDDDEVGEVLFQLSDGQVLTDNLAFWYAENHAG